MADLQNKIEDSGYVNEIKLNLDNNFEFSNYITVVKYNEEKSKIVSARQVKIDYELAINLANKLGATDFDYERYKILYLDPYRENDKKLRELSILPRDKRTAEIEQQIHDCNSKRSAYIQGHKQFIDSLNNFFRNKDLSLKQINFETVKDEKNLETITGFSDEIENLFEQRQQFQQGKQENVSKEQQENQQQRHQYDNEQYSIEQNNLKNELNNEVQELLSSLRKAKSKKTFNFFKKPEPTLKELIMQSSIKEGVSNENFKQIENVLNDFDRMALSDNAKMSQHNYLMQNPDYSDVLEEFSNKLSLALNKSDISNAAIKAILIKYNDTSLREKIKELVPSKISAEQLNIVKNEYNAIKNKVKNEVLAKYRTDIDPKSKKLLDFLATYEEDILNYAKMHPESTLSADQLKNLKKDAKLQKEYSEYYNVNWENMGTIKKLLGIGTIAGLATTFMGPIGLIAVGYFGFKKLQKMGFNKRMQNYQKMDSNNAMPENFLDNKISLIERFLNDKESLNIMLARAQQSNPNLILKNPNLSNMEKINALNKIKIKHDNFTKANFFIPNKQDEEAYKAYKNIEKEKLYEKKYGEDNTGIIKRILKDTKKSWLTGTILGTLSFCGGSALMPAIVGGACCSAILGGIKTGVKSLLVNNKVNNDLENKSNLFYYVNKNFNNNSQQIQSYIDNLNIQQQNDRNAGKNNFGFKIG